MKIEEFVKAAAYLGMAYGKEYSQAETQQMYEFLKEYSYQTIIDAVNSIIRKSKFAPKIADLIEECENCKSTTRFEVLKYMRKTGYFKLGIIRENGDQIILTDEHAMRNYEKASRFLERGIVPDWLQEDINYYYNKMHQERLSGNTVNLLK